MIGYWKDSNFLLDVNEKKNYFEKSPTFHISSYMLNGGNLYNALIEWVSKVCYNIDIEY